MNSEERAAIRARLDAATPGPWQWAVTEDRHWAQVWHDGYGDVVARCADDDDAAFIAHARTDVERLLDALDDAERDISGLKNSVRAWADDESACMGDVRELLDVLGLGTHARAASPHEVMRDEVLPAVDRLTAALRDPSDAAPPTPGPDTEPGTTGTATVRGVPGVRVMRIWRDPTDPYPPSPWVSARSVDSYIRHDDSDLADFVPDPQPTPEPECDCYPYGFTPDTYEGPQEHCPVHGRPATPEPASALCECGHQAHPDTWDCWVGGCLCTAYRPAPSPQPEPNAAAARARRIADAPDAASDSDKLRTIADYLDMDDARHGLTGTDAQDFLRGLADRLRREVEGAER